MVIPSYPLIGSGKRAYLRLDCKEFIIEGTGLAIIIDTPDGKAGAVHAMHSVLYWLDR